MRSPRGIRKVALSLAMFVVVALASAITAQADPVTFVLGGPDFSGPTANTGGNITVHIANIAGGVRVTVTNNLDLTSTTLGFTSDSFLVFAAPGGGHGPFRAAAHLQGLPNGESDFVTEEIPEPTSMLLLGTGIATLAAGLRRRYRP
jgi:hypothetical protein